MHLRDADLFGDLSLRHVLEEPHHDDLSFAFTQRGEQWLQRLAVLHTLECVIFRTQGLGQRRWIGIVIASA